ncbi:MAG: MFS transporter [Kocuria palustris]|nr:MFS transporter [Kocuria palustris]
MGRRRVFLGDLIIFTLASIARGLSSEVWMLILARAIQGAGGAAIMPLSLTLLSTSVPEKMRPMAIGVWGGVSGLGIALGPLIAGAVVEGLSWQAIFWLNIPIGVLRLPPILAALPESYGRPQRLDLLGLAIAGVFLVVFGIVRGEEAGWSSGEVLASLIGGGALLIAFIAWEARAPEPMMPLRLFRNRSFAVANIVGVLFSLGIFGAVFIRIQFLQVAQGASALKAGGRTMPWTMAPLVVAPLAGLITPRIGVRPAIVAGLACMTASLVWIALVWRRTSSTSGWCLPTRSRGSAWGWCSPRSPPPCWRGSPRRTRPWPPGRTRRPVRSAWPWASRRCRLCSRPQAAS